MVQGNKVSTDSKKYMIYDQLDLSQGRRDKIFIMPPKIQLLRNVLIAMVTNHI